MAVVNNTQPPDWDPLPPWPTEAPEVDHAEAKRRAQERKKKSRSKKARKGDHITASFVGGPCNGQKMRVMTKGAPDEIVLDMGREVYARRKGTKEWHYTGPKPRLNEGDLELVNQEFELETMKWKQ